MAAITKEHIRINGYVFEKISKNETVSCQVFHSYHEAYLWTINKQPNIIECYYGDYDET